MMPSFLLPALFFISSAVAPGGPNFYVPYSTDINATISTGGGSLTGTSHGGAAVSGGKLDLRGPVSAYVSFDGVGNASGAVQTLTMQVKYTPNYTGAPGQTRLIGYVGNFGISNANMIEWYNAGNGIVGFDLFDFSGGFITDFSFGGWSPVSGVEYLMELDIDATAGEERMFIDGVQQGSTALATTTRSSAVTSILTGTGGGGQQADGQYRDFKIFNTVQHTANYTP